MPKIQGEEKKLKMLFAEQWDSFIRQTGIFFPKQFKPSRLVSKWSFKHWIHHTEYNAWIAVAVAFTVIHFWAVS